MWASRIEARPCVDRGGVVVSGRPAKRLSGVPRRFPEENAGKRTLEMSRIIGTSWEAGESNHLCLQERPASPWIDLNCCESRWLPAL
jgi:hypothetical protein